MKKLLVGVTLTPQHCPSCGHGHIDVIDGTAGPQWTVRTSCPSCGQEAFWGGDAGRGIVGGIYAVR